jgi:hypothetical protein
VRKRSPAAERHAELIRTALFEVTPGGLKRNRLMSSCELEARQRDNKFPSPSAH